MKKKIKLFTFSFTVLVFVLVLTNGCKKDDNNNNPTPPTTVTDIDGNVYHTVKIGTQVWLVENLKVTKYRNGDPIPNVTNDTQWSKLSTGAYCYYNNVSDSGIIYGKLYNWYAVIDTRNIAPIGWHIATDAEWTTLFNFLGSDSLAGGKLKEKGTNHWNNPNTGATNEKGFTALPGGNRYYFTGEFKYIRKYGLFWSTTQLSTDWANRYCLSYASSNVSHAACQKRDGNTVRCLKDK